MWLTANVAVGVTARAVAGVFVRAAAKADAGVAARVDVKVDAKVAAGAAARNKLIRRIIMWGIG
jgi:hypothetical protein